MHKRKTIMINNINNKKSAVDKYGDWLVKLREMNDLFAFTVVFASSITVAAETCGIKNSNVLQKN